MGRFDQRSVLLTAGLGAIGAAAAAAAFSRGKSLGPPPPPPGPRTALAWPGSVGAYPNISQGTGAQYDLHVLAARTGNNAFKPQEIPMGMDATQPVTGVYQNSGQQGNRCADGPNGHVLLGSVPFDQNLVVPSETTNYPPAFIGADGVSRFEGGNFGHCAKGGTPYAGHFGNRGSIIDDAVGGGSGGSGLSTLYGTIRWGELTHGTAGERITMGGKTFALVRHTVRVDLSVQDLSPAGSGWRWPANKADNGYQTSYKGRIASLVNGSCLVLPQTIDLESFIAGLRTVAGAQFAWIFYNYGGYVANTQNGLLMAIATEWSTAGRVGAPITSPNQGEFYNLYGYPMVASPSSAYGSDMNAITTNLAVIKNNAVGSIGGGGTPLQPPAPPFSS